MTYSAIPSAVQNSAINTQISDAIRRLWQLSQLDVQATWRSDAGDLRRLTTPFTRRQHFCGKPVEPSSCPYVACIGIDWADQKDDICLYDQSYNALSSPSSAPNPKQSISGSKD